MPQPGDVELAEIRAPQSPDAGQPQDSESAASNETDALPPIDGGTAAWRLLIAAFIFEALLWGFPLSFGVFQDYYSSIPAFRDNPYISIVGTTASGISYLGAPLIMPLTRSKYSTKMIYIGWPMCITALVAGSFANSLGTLILTQGVMYGFGFLIFYYPIIEFVSQYWVRRRGMAYGLLCASSGVSGAAMPLMLQALLQRYGYKTTLRIIAIALTVTTGPLIAFIKPRSRHQQSGTGKTDWAFLKMRLFWVYSVSNLLMGLGYFFPALYLPSYATSMGLSTTLAGLLLAIMSVSQVAGQFTFGYLSDKKVSLSFLMLISLSVSAVATFGAWGAASSLAPLLIFAMLYGFFGAAYTSLWARMSTAISEDPAAAQTVFGTFNFGKGIGNVLAGPISAALLKASRNLSGGYGGMYRAIVLFPGLCLLLSAASLGPLFCRMKGVMRRPT
jgi:predicted MFS family arabinose efflux permease